MTKEVQYTEALTSIEKLIAKATDNGGVASLTTAEKEQLSHLGLLAEQYEDKVLKIMPLTVL